MMGESRTTLQAFFGLAENWRDGPVDPKKLARKPYNLFKAERVKGKRAVATEVSVPEPEETQDLLVSEQVSEEDTVRSITQHTEIQFNSSLLIRFLLFSCSAFVTTVHDEVYDAFMTPPPYNNA